MITDAELIRTASSSAGWLLIAPLVSSMERRVIFGIFHSEGADCETVFRRVLHGRASHPHVSRSAPVGETYNVPSEAGLNKK